MRVEHLEDQRVGVEQVEGGRGSGMTNVPNGETGSLTGQGAGSVRGGVSSSGEIESDRRDGSRAKPNNKTGVGTRFRVSGPGGRVKRGAGMTNRPRRNTGREGEADS